MKTDDCRRVITEPFIKWPGGKRWIAPAIVDLIRRSLHGRYFEPFLGSGAVFFRLKHADSQLSDINANLVTAYATVRNRPDEVLRGLWRLSNTPECYYPMRGSSPRTAVGRAVRFIFLSKTCWGGIYRLNRKGQFNVPFGDSGRVICRKENLMAVAKVLKPVTLKVADFEDAMASVRRGDVVYADPPYTTLGENNGFLRYNERLFAWEDQMRLASCSWRAHRVGATAIISGLCHQSVLGLYPGWWLIRITRRSRVSRQTSGHRNVTEVLITNTLPPADIAASRGSVERIPI